MRFSDDREIGTVYESRELDSDEEDLEYISFSRVKNFRNFYLARSKLRRSTREADFAASKKRYEREATLFQRAQRGINTG